MKVWEGSSRAEDAALAVEEATRAFPEDQRVDMVFVFHSTKQDPDGVATALRARFPEARIAGCTTAGEHLSGKHFNGALVVAGVSSPSTRWNVVVTQDLAQFDQARAEAIRDELLAGLGVRVDDLDPQRHFCVTFMDGLSMREETVTAHMAEALSGLPLVGGSAGDDLQFKRTRIIADGRAYDGAAVFVMAESDEGFRVLKHQHFVRTAHALVVTKVDLERRIVVELDGMPATHAYAQALGVRRDEFTPDLAFANPLTFECNGQIYVRSPQRIDADGSIQFYCAIEEGMVLDVGGHLAIDEALTEDRDPSSPKAELLLACNCILRALEAEKAGKHDALGAELLSRSSHVLGFDTYGEQLNGLHINQTIVGLALGRAA